MASPQVIVVAQPRGNFAATLAIVFVVLGIVTCCLPVVPWVFAFLGIVFAVLGLGLAVMRGGHGLGMALTALVLSFVPFVPILIVGAFVASFFAARDRVLVELPAIDAEPVVVVDAPSIPPTVLQPEPQPEPKVEPKPEPKPEPKVVYVDRPVAVAPAPSIARVWPATRVWNQVDGAQFLAEFHGFTSGVVKLRTEAGDWKRIGDDTLCEADRQWIRARATHPPEEVVRGFSDDTGQFSVEAEYLGVERGKVRLRRKSDGKIVGVPVERLSTADREWIRSAEPGGR